MRRPYGSLVVERYVYLHNQHPHRGIIVRKNYYHRGEYNGCVSKYFSVRRYGSFMQALRRAIQWRNRRFGSQPITWSRRQPLVPLPKSYRRVT